MAIPARSDTSKCADGLVVFVATPFGRLYSSGQWQKLLLHIASFLTTRERATGLTLVCRDMHSIVAKNMHQLSAAWLHSQLVVRDVAQHRKVVYSSSSRRVGHPSMGRVAGLGWSSNSSSSGSNININSNSSSSTTITTSSSSNSSSSSSSAGGGAGGGAGSTAATRVATGSVDRGSSGSSIGSSTLSKRAKPRKRRAARRVTIQD